jgi:HK97 family phage major capsid protein
MTLEEQKAALDQLGDKINNKLNEATEKIAKGEKATSAVKDELNKLIEDHKTQTDAVIAKHEEAAGRIDSLETKLQRLSKAEQEAETFGSKMEKAMTETLSEKGHVSGIFTFEGMDTKAIMLQTTALTGDVIQPDRVRGIVSPMERERHIRPYMASGRTGSNTVDYVEETAYTDGMAGVAEGAALAQSDLTLEQKTAAVKKVGSFVTLSREMLEDISGLMSYVQGRLVAKYNQREDTQLLAGDGTGQNLAGVALNATAWADPGAISNGNAFDVLRAAVKQAQVDEYFPNLILVHPNELFAMDTAKESTGAYLLPYIFNGQGHNISGIPIVATTAIAPDNFLIGDFQRGAQIFDRREITLEIASENSDDWQKDLVSAKLTTRLAFPIYRPDVFIKGVMSTSITALGS